MEDSFGHTQKGGQHCRMTIVVHSFDAVLALVCLYCCVKFLRQIKIIGGVDDSNIALDVGLPFPEVFKVSTR
jgi:hypothetical protein